MKTRILIGDDHDVFRITLKHFINDNKDMAVTAEAKTWDDTYSLAFNRNFDLILLDIDLLASNGFGVLHDLKRGKPHLPVIVYGLLPEKILGLPTILAGASGYIEKDYVPKHLINTVRQALNNKNCSVALFKWIIFSHLFALSRAHQKPLVL
ncbi:MAG: response regulator [bacterium]